jgi:hypothetical protein
MDYTKWWANGEPSLLLSTLESTWEMLNSVAIRMVSWMEKCSEVPCEDSLDTKISQLGSFWGLGAGRAEARAGQ